MNLDSPYASRVFNSLLEIVLDSADGYEEAAGLARNPRFRSLFADRAQGRREAAHELEAAIVALGDQPSEEGSILGHAHRAFVALRDRIAGASDRALVDEVERGEGFIDDKFQAAARDGALSDGQRALVERLSGAIGADHESIQDLKAEFG